MKAKSKGAFAAACLSLLALAALTGGGATPAGAASAFPGQGFLPHNRAWEMVSPIEKNGGYAVPDSSRTRAAADGSALGWISLAPFGDVLGSGVATDYISQRSADPDPGHNGWATHAITPTVPANTFRGITSGLEPLYDREFSADLRRGVFFSHSALTEDFGVEGALNLYRRTDLRTPGAGSYELLTACPFCGETGEPLPRLSGTSTDFNLRPDLASTSPDFEHLTFESQQRLTKDTPTTTDRRRLFEWEAGAVRLAGLTPPGAASECDDAGATTCVPADVSLAAQGAQGFRPTPHSVSDGHHRVFFLVPTNAAGAPVIDGREGNLYVRTDATTTAKLNVSERAVPDPNGFAPATYWDATPDGSRAFFTSAQALTDDAPADSQAKLYAYETTKPASAPDNLTLLAADRETEDEGNVLGLIGASANGEYAYFLATGQLIDGKPLIDTGHVIYLWHEGELRLVGRLSSSSASTYLELLTIPLDAVFNARQARLSADGRRLLFSSRERSGLIGDPGGACTTGVGAPNGQCHELYLYDAEDESLRCVSCPPGGGPSDAGVFVRRFGGGAKFGAHEGRPLSAEGRFVFFSTAEKLVPADTNGVSDAYVYDSATEEQSLLSSGEDGSPSFFLDASADGSDVFIATSERLSRWDVGDDYDIYDARVNGGFPEPPPPPPGCQGDACQPAPLELNDATPGSAGLTGPGDPKAGKPKPRCPKGKRRVKARSGKSRCVKRNRKPDAKRKGRAGR